MVHYSVRHFNIFVKVPHLQESGVLLFSWNGYSISVYPVRRMSELKICLFLLYISLLDFLGIL